MSLPRIAVDAMGGDEGVRVMIEGAALARRRHDRFKFLLVGDEDRIRAALEAHPNLRARSVMRQVRAADGSIHEVFAALPWLAPEDPSPLSAPGLGEH